MIFGEHFSHPCKILQQAADCLQQFRRANNNRNFAGNLTTGNSTVQKWEAPLAGFFKANWGIAIDQVENRMGVGVMI